MNKKSIPIFITIFFTLLILPDLSAAAEGTLSSYNVSPNIYAAEQKLENVNLQILGIQKNIEYLNNRMREKEGSIDHEAKTVNFSRLKKIFETCFWFVKFHCVSSFEDWSGPDGYSQMKAAAVLEPSFLKEGASVADLYNRKRLVDYMKEAAAYLGRGPKPDMSAYDFLSIYEWSKAYDKSRYSVVYIAQVEKKQQLRILNELKSAYENEIANTAGIIELNELRQRLDSVVYQNNELLNKNKALSQTLNQAEEEIATLLSGIADIRQLWSEDVEKLKNEHSRQIQWLNRANIELKNNEKTLQDETSKFKNEINLLNIGLKEKDEIITKLNEELKSFRSSAVLVTLNNMGDYRGVVFFAAVALIVIMAFALAASRLSLSSSEHRLSHLIEKHYGGKIARIHLPKENKVLRVPIKSTPDGEYTKTGFECASPNKNFVLIINAKSHLGSCADCQKRSVSIGENLTQSSKF